MNVQPTELAEEIKRLQRCINDLVRVHGLPATSGGGDPPQIVHALLDALLNMLQLDLIYAQLKDPGNQTSIEVVQFAQSEKQITQPQEIGDLLKLWLGADPQEWPPLARNRLGDRDISIAPLGLGLQGELGVIVAAAERANFPQQTERLILDVAANWVAIGLQGARALSEEGQVARELDRRVAERATELAATNKKLQKEITERRVIEERAREGEVDVKESEAKLRRVIDTIPTLSWCNRTDGTNEFLSKRWHDYTGLSPEEAQGWGWQLAFHSEDLPPLMKRWQELLISGESGEIEARLRRYDGVFRWFLIRVSPFMDEAGSIVRWYGTSTDIHDRKLAEEELRSRARHFSLVIDTMPVLAWSAGSDGRVDFFNQRWLNYTGLSPAQAQDWGWAQAFHPEDLDRVTAYWQSIVATGESGEIEARLRRFDGEYRWFLFRTEPLRDESGSIVKWYGTNTDIDDRKHAEEALRESERSFRLILNGIAGLVAIMSATGETEVVNLQTLDYFGKTVEQLKGWSTGSEVHSEDLPGVYAAWMHSVKTASIYDVDHRLRRADGVYRWFHARGLPLCDSESSVLRWYVLLTDIDDRKHAEEDMRISEEKHRLVVETAPDAVISIDERSTIQFVNPGTATIFGYDPTELIGKPLTVLMPEFLREVHRNGFRRYLATGQRHINWQGTELTAQRKNGQVFPVEVSFGELSRDGHKVFTGFIRDISDKKQAEDKLRASERSLQVAQAELARVSRLTTMGELAASIAHEVNQPLTAVVNNGSACLRLLANSNLEPEVLHQALEGIVADGTRASNVLARIRAFIKKEPAQKNELNINEVIQEVLVLAGRELHENQVLLDHQLKTDLPIVLADRVQLQQVLLNLIMNGIEAMSAVTDRPRLLGVQSRIDESRDVLVAVSDSGTGFGPEADRVFAPFFTTKAKGMGMGLSISRSLVESHGGRLWATPNSPHGAVFSFTLPATGEKPS